MSDKIKFKEVDEATFEEFLKTYPNPLVRDVAMMYEPPFISFNDFSLAPRWPESIVASYVCGEGGWRVLDTEERPTPL